MDIDYFIKFNLLMLVCLIFIAGFLFRSALFVLATIRSSRKKDRPWTYNCIVFLRALLPFHKAVSGRVFYALIRYVFHACLIVIPIWYSEHIFLWEQYGLEWEWTAIPDGLSDILTLLMLALSVYFLIRRIFFKRIRRNSGTWDYLLIIITALPFLTGYLLSRESLEYTPFFGDHMEIIHILTAEVMILTAAFLFCTVRLDERICTGCASCELQCPTDALMCEDRKDHRVFTYALYQCICCGSCVNTCPEYAAELRHGVGFDGYHRMCSRQTLQSVSIRACEICGVHFAPEPQLEKLKQTIEADYINLCLRCKREVSARRALLG